MLQNFRANVLKVINAIVNYSDKTLYSLYVVDCLSGVVSYPLSK